MDYHTKHVVSKFLARVENMLNKIFDKDPNFISLLEKIEILNLSRAIDPKYRRQFLKQDPLNGIHAPIVKELAARVLREVAIRGETTHMKKLMSVLDQREDGLPALTQAVMFNKVKSVKELFALGVPVDVNDISYKQALSIGDVDILTLFNVKLQKQGKNKTTSSKNKLKP